MKLDRLAPMLQTKNLRETIEFYTRVLGFECVESNEEWCALAHGPVNLMFAVSNENPTEKLGFTGSFYFYPENVDELWEELKEKTNLAYGIDDFEYGMREFAIYDNNGYLLRFGNVIKS